MSKATLPVALRIFDELPGSAWVDVRTVAALYGCSIGTAWRRSASGQIPPPRRFGSSARWSVAQLRESLSPISGEPASCRS
ncbi:hypothetical protein Bxe_A3655 [Paraburkholderia xenovorans LB400]|uniref:Uncharacterized protein n=1 Tax=Paraburkholderia xenovorans (strain LB400) TaxID=266265 RepID=Q144A6_PARXL|nr:hypothetical protein Bxe_A3655 [Paraburkholderia xenovorans LB400]